MLPEHRSLLEELKEEISMQEAERVCSWVDSIPYDINFWHFLDNIPHKDRRRFFTLLDIENSAESGWARFCEAIGLKSWADQKWCELYQDGKGPTQTAFIRIKENEDHNDDLTLFGVLDIIREMDRLDILNQIDWRSLADEYRATIENKNPSLSSSATKEFVIVESQPPLLPLTQSENLGLLDDSNVESCIRQVFPKKKKKMRTKQPWILMTFASDAKDIAQKVSHQLRQETECRPKIGVLLISDPVVRRQLSPDPNASLHKWFHEAWYIVPILSPEYLRQIQNLGGKEEDNEEALNNRLLYRLTFDQFCSLGSLNYRCRAICPPSYRAEVRNSSIVQGNGLFKPLWSSSPQKIEELSSILLDAP